MSSAKFSLTEPSRTAATLQLLNVLSALPPRLVRGSATISCAPGISGELDDTQPVDQDPPGITVSLRSLCQTVSMTAHLPDSFLGEYVCDSAFSIGVNFSAFLSAIKEGGCTIQLQEEGILIEDVDLSFRTRIKTVAPDPAMESDRSAQLPLVVTISADLLVFLFQEALSVATLESTVSLKLDSEGLAVSSEDQATGLACELIAPAKAMRAEISDSYGGEEFDTLCLSIRGWTVGVVLKIWRRKKWRKFNSVKEGWEWS